MAVKRVCWERERNKTDTKDIITCWSKSNQQKRGCRPVFPKASTFLVVKFFVKYFQRNLSRGMLGRPTQKTNAQTLMLLFIFHSYSSADSLCWGLVPSQTSLWCPCWQQWWGCQCRSVWSCGMWRSFEGPPAGNRKWVILQMCVMDVVPLPTGDTFNLTEDAYCVWN